MENKEANWVQYKCKSGRTLLICNQEADEHKVLVVAGESSSDQSMAGRKVMCSTGTQTDDNGCQNGCTSMYLTNISMVTSKDDSQQQDSVLISEGMGDYLDVEPGAFHVDIRLHGGTEESNSNVDEMVNIYLGNDNRDLNKERLKKKKSPVPQQKSPANKNNKKTPMQCEYCKKEFKFKRVYEDHVKTHTGEKPLKCSHCNKRFILKSNLKDHVTTHTGEKPFECSYCPKRFALKKQLKYHIRIHTGEKPFECNYCEKKFTRKDGLNIHIKVHTGEKPYECNYCEKKFAQRKHLNVHLKIHTRENLFECTYCKKEFTRKDNLKTHLKVHIGK